MMLVSFSSPIPKTQKLTLRNKFSLVAVPFNLPKSASSSKTLKPLSVPWTSICCALFVVWFSSTASIKNLMNLPGIEAVKKQFFYKLFISSSAKATFHKFRVYEWLAFVTTQVAQINDWLQLFCHWKRFCWSNKEDLNLLLSFLLYIFILGSPAQVFVFSFKLFLEKSGVLEPQVMRARAAIVGPHYFLLQIAVRYNTARVRSSS